MKRIYEEINYLNTDITHINKNIDTIEDLIYLGELYKPHKKYNINIEKIYNILPILKKLNNIIGMESVKKSIINQIIFFIQDFQDKNTDMMHIVIQGPPGVGKTMLGEIIGEIYFKINIIEEPDDIKNQECIDCNEETTNKRCKKEFKFTIARRSDLIGKYLGHTAAKTQEVINKSLGGVLFIDEAYSLGNDEGKDSFSKECIDTINQNLSEKKNQLLVIIAGYKEALDTCFFSYNEGLRRRFPFVYTIEPYTPEEMSLILIKMVNNIGDNWKIMPKNNILNKFFQKNIKLFNNSAGDIETLVFYIKLQHSRRVLCYPLGSPNRRNIINIDIEKAFEFFLNNKKEKGKEKEKEKELSNMYS